MKVLLRLLPYLQAHKWAFIFGMSGLLLARFFEALIPLFVKMGIDEISIQFESTAAVDLAQAQSALLYPAIAISICVLSQIIITVISRTLVRRIGMYAAFDLRNRMYQHLQLQSSQFYGRYNIGDLMARAINDISLVRQVIAGTTRLTAVLIFTAIVGLGFMFSLSFKLTLAVLLPLPLITFVAYRYSKLIYRQSHKVQTGFSSLSTFVQENLNGIRTVQAMAQEDQEVSRFRQVNQTFADHNLQLFKTTSLLSALLPVLATVSTLTILAYGSHLVNTQEITVGTFVAFFSYLGLLLWPVREAGSMVTQWQRGASGAERLFEILDHAPDIKDKRQHELATNDVIFQGHLKVTNLYYQYENKNKYALENINFEVEAGETIAILGRVGSGKSTLLRLFVRLLDPTQGDIYLDKHKLDEYSLETLRQQIYMVLQDPFLFADSLNDNIAYDNPDRNQKDIWRSADAAALRETIENFPDGLDTLIGERGVNLSGGQKQRTALARGLIRMTPLLILDDCFSAVDTETEEHILTGLKRARENLTTILVSHRVSTARHADRIIVVEKGKLIEMGTHNELMQKQGFYAELESIQNIKKNSDA